MSVLASILRIAAAYRVVCRMIADRFFVWVTEASVEQRVRAVDALVRAWSARTASEEERDGLEAALTLVGEDEAIEVRRALAEALVAIDEAPRHLLLGLLWDHPVVGEIVARRSDALIDPELVDAVAGGDARVRLAVARRRRVGPSVSIALAEAAERPAALALLTNPGADVPIVALERLVDRFGEFSDLREALMTRPHVPITIRHRVLEKLAEAMGELVVVQEWMRGDRAETVTRDAKDRATVALAAAAGDAETTVLVDHLRRTGQLTTRLLLRAACIGDLRFVEESLALLAGVPVRRVAALVADGRESAFRALYAKANMPDRAFPAFSAALEIHRELLRETGGWDGRAGDRARFARRLVERVLTRYGAFERRDGDDLLALLRRFAADAARDHVRALVAERTAEARRLLAAPLDGDFDGLDAAVAGARGPVPDFEIDLAPPVERVPRDLDEEAAPVAETVAAEEPFAPVFAVEPSDLEVDTSAFEAAIAAAALADLGRSAAPTETVAVDAEPDELDGPIGLFDHVDLADLPPDWIGDAEPIPLFATPRPDEGPRDAAVDFGRAFFGELRGGIAA